MSGYRPHGEWRKGIEVRPLFYKEQGFFEVPRYQETICVRVVDQRIRRIHLEGQLQFHFRFGPLPVRIRFATVGVKAGLLEEP